MLETLVQAGRLLVEGRCGVEGESDPGPGTGGDGPLVLADVRSVRYGNMVRPGQTLQVEVTLRGCQDGRWDFAGVGRVDDQVAVQGRFSLEPMVTASPAV